MPTTPRPWTPQDIVKLRSLAQQKPASALARELGRSRPAVFRKAQKLHIPLRKHLWTPQEDDLLRSLPDLPPRQLVELLPGRTPHQISVRRYRLCITRGEQSPLSISRRTPGKPGKDNGRGAPAPVLHPVGFDGPKSAEQAGPPEGSGPSPAVCDTELRLKKAALASR